MPRNARALARRISIALSTGVLFAPAVSAADSLLGTESESLVEKADTAELRVGRGHADLIVRRTVFNDGPRQDQAVFFLGLPGGAVATGLRSLGLKNGKPFWFDGELMGAEVAASKYAELGSMNGAQPKEPALLSWRSQSTLELELFPVPSQEQKTVEYTLRMPTAFREGRDHVDLGALGIGDRPVDFAVRTVDPSDGLIIDGVRVGREAHVTLKENIDIALTRHAPPRFGGALAMVPFADKRVLVHQHTEVASPVSEVPRAAGVVVAIDASRSLSDTELTLEIAAARAYLGNFTDARAEVLTFDRDVRAWHGGLVPVKDAIRDLDRIPIQRGNGSRVDEALARAGALLATLPPHAARRIVVFTDTLTRESLTAERLAPAIAATHALVHVATIGASSPSVERNDDHEWAKGVRASGGLVWQASASAEDKDAGAMRAAYEELARPLRIDKLRWEVPGVDPESLGFPSTLAEGEGVEDLRITKLRVGWVKAEGEIWSTPIQSVLLPDESEGKVWSALVFGSALQSDLTEQEMMALAKRGGAVSPVTSYVTLAPGVRPTFEGLEEGGSGIATCGGIGSGIGIGRLGSLGHGPDLGAILRDALNKGFLACGGATHSATVALETTLREVVDVGSVEVDGERIGTLAACLQEVAWNLDLPRDFRSSQAKFSIDL